MSTANSTLCANGFTSAPVRANYAFDDGPGVYRIGLVTLASDYTTERDFKAMSPNDDTVVYASRVLNVNPCTLENLCLMAPRITDAVSLIVPDGRLDVLAYSCTSGTVAIGYDRIAASVRVARPGIACVTPLTSAVAALERLQANNVAVLTPYVDSVNASIASYLEARGKSIVQFKSFALADDNDMARIPPEAIVEAALETDTATAEALFVSCTAIRAVEVVHRIEQALGKPVITANQAMFWQALRCAGCTDPVAGFGALLEL